MKQNQLSIIHFLYAVDHNVFFSLYYNIYNQYIDNNFTIGEPPMSKEEFWTHQINVATPDLLKKYERPNEFYKKLKKITEYCKKNSINLVFIIFPEHKDLYNKIKYLGFKKTI